MMCVASVPGGNCVGAERGPSARFARFHAEAGGHEGPRAVRAPVQVPQPRRYYRGRRRIAHLNVDMTDTQRSIIQPSDTDLLLGSIVRESNLGGSDRKLPQRRMNTWLG